MQVRYLKLFVLMISTSLLFTACSKSNEETAMIPNDATFVMHFDGKKIQSKLPWTEVKQNSLFQSVVKDSSLSEFVQTLLDNPENSGIDINGQLYAFATRDSLGGYMAFIGTVKDANKFTKFSQEITQLNTKAESEDGINFIASEKILSSWKDKRFLIIADMPQEVDLRGMVDFSQPESQRKAPVDLPDRNLKSLSQNLFDLKLKETLAKDARFSEMLSGGGDLQVWVNAESINKQASPAMQMGPMSMLNLDKLYSGSILTFNVNFEAGKILVASKSYAGTEVTEIWKKYTGTKIDGDMITRLPQTDIAAVFAFNFKPQGITELLKLSALDGLVNMAMGQIGISLDDVIKANKGDFVLSISDLKLDEKNQLQPIILFGTAIGDQPSMDKIMSLVDSLQGREIDSSIYITKGFKHIAISNNKQAADQFAAGTVTHKFDFYNKLSESAITGIIDFQNIFSKIKLLPISQDTIQMSRLQASEKTFENIIFTGGVFNNGGLIQNMEINFVNKDSNSLKQLNNYLEEMQRINEIKPVFSDTVIFEN